MNTERWQHVREVLDHAIALPADGRPAYLEKVCAGDAELRVEVESLLNSHERAGEEFLGAPAIDLRSLLPDIEGRPSYIGRRIGVYKIVEQIGYGGMGEVYRASRMDGQYDKQVAIKLVRIGLATSALLERFRTERQILASLDHPNIARLHDGGASEDGLPYLVMELIEGTPVDQYCDQHHLGITERLQLFLQICAAVQYAHQRLVIHRDIKPSNILVTADGVPKLLDFGIAKMLDPSGDPETTALRPMTPEYASPEQIRGEPITTATDVYSLGVVLYWLLTGRSLYPKTTRTPHELAQLICQAEPTRPSLAVLRQTRSLPEASSKLEKGLKGDLDNIVLKALRKEPDRRYASAEQLAEDIRRHLAGLPITATPSSLAYRASKFVRRHKVGVATSVVIVSLIVAGIAATLREARIASANQLRAERRFNDVRKLANSFLFEFDDAIEYLPGSTPARSLVVKRALEYLEGLAAEAGGDRSLQMEIASAYKKVGKVQGDPMFPNLGDSRGALESFRKAQAILESLSRAEPQNEQVRLALASTHQQISDVLDSSGDTTGAVEHSKTALNMYEALAGRLANDRNFQIARVTQTYQYANLLKSVGALEEAAAEYRQAVELSQQMITASPSDPEGKVHLATSLDGLGNVLQDQGDTAGALENRRKGLTIREELARLDPNNSHYRRQLAFSHHNVGASLVQAGDLTVALAHFRQELSLFESLSTADPKDAQARRNRSLAEKMIGDVLMRTGEFQGGLAQYRVALDIDRDLAAMDPGNSQAALDLSFSEGKVGSALGKLGQRREASILLRSAIARQESLLTKDPHDILLHSDLANSYSSFAGFLLDSADTKAAVDFYRKAVAARLTLSEKIPNSSANHIALAACYTNLSQALVPNEREDALRQSNNAVALLERLTVADRSNAHYRVALAEALMNTGRLYVRLAGRDEQPSTRIQDWTKARSFYQRSEALWQELQRAGRLPSAQRKTIREVNDELAQCNDSLAKLQVH